MSISILMLWRPLRLGPSRHSSFIISSAHERKTEICARMISSWLDVLGRMPAGRWSEWGNQDIFWDYKKVTNERTCERLRHRALLWWLWLWMLCNRRVREDGTFPVRLRIPHNCKKFSLRAKNRDCNVIFRNWRFVVESQREILKK